MPMESAYYPQSEGPWKDCAGPANWFTFRCPASLTLRKRESQIELCPHGIPAAQPVLTIMAWWDDLGLDLVESLPDLDLLFPNVVMHNRLPSFPMNVTNDVYSGTSHRRPSASLLQRLSLLVSQNSCYQWRLWRFQSGNLCVAAIAESQGGRSLTSDQLMMCAEILSTLRFSERPAWPPDVFQRQALLLARRYFPLIPAALSAGFTLRLGDSEISLSSLYRLYLQQTDSFQRIVLPGLTSMVRLQELGARFSNPELPDVRDQILPVIVNSSSQQTADKVLFPWVADLSIGFVIDEDDTYRFVQQRLLEIWCLSPDQLLEIAMENLRTYVEQHPPRFTLGDESDDGPLLIPVDPSPYNCSLILDPGVRQLLLEQLGQRLVLGLPNRDFFAVMPQSAPQQINRLQRQIRENYSSVEDPLTRRLLLLSADGVSELCD